MNISIAFIRVFFTLLSILFFTTYTTTTFSGGFNLINTMTGLMIGLVFSGLLVCLDFLFKRFNLRLFIIASIGLFFGYLLGEAILFVLNGIFDFSTIQLQPQALTLLKTGVYLFSIYLGMIMTLRSADDLHVSIPFIKFKPTNHEKKDVLIDSSVLVDSRLIDLASSGLVDHHLILPRFILKELYAMSEGQDEALKSKARRCLEVIKKLEDLPELNLRYVDTDFPEVKDTLSKLIRLARFLDANIITSDMNRIQQASIKGIRVININNLASALQPLTQNGEFITIKIQRYGKEAKQGVGYLDDGTMVVVNGGADFLGDAIKAQVLSVKHTTSGRMIFCNALDANGNVGPSIVSDYAMSEALSDGHKNHYSL